MVHTYLCLDIFDEAPNHRNSEYSRWLERLNSEFLAFPFYLYGFVKTGESKDRTRLSYTVSPFVTAVSPSDFLPYNKKVAVVCSEVA